MYWLTVKIVFHVQNKRLKKHSLKNRYLSLVYNQWNSFALISLVNFIPLPQKVTAVCMLTCYTFCIPIKNKTAEEVITAWRNHISFPFGVCRKLLSDNGTEFKNDLFTHLADQLGVERKIYSLSKHISRHRE